jgi:hypothetical protein
MTLRRPNLLMALGVALSVASAAYAGEVPINKGKVAKSGAGTCSVVLQSADSTTITTVGKKTVIQCGDGAACDKDNAKNGSCSIGVNVCTGAEGCTAEPVESIKTAAKAKKAAIVPPTTPQTAVTSTCGTEGTIVIPLKGKNKDKASALGKGKMIVKAKLGSGKGNVVAFVQCTPDATPCTDCPVGPTCADREAPGLPKQITLVVPGSGSDLDNGFSGNSHNFPTPEGSTLRYCMTNCDATTDSVCDMAGSTGPAASSLNGPVFGPPLPLLSQGVPVCVVNRYADAALTGTYDLATGELSGQVNLLSDVHVQTPLTDVCPRCNGAGLGQSGTCTSGANQGKACVVDGTSNVVGSAGNTLYNLSTQCPPEAARRAATLTIGLPLTTGTSTSAQQSKPCQGQTVDDACGGAGTCTVDCSATVPAKGGINQTCCSNNPVQPCFPTAPDSPPGQIIREGTPAAPLPVWPDPTYPKTVEGGRSAAVFCEAATGDSTVDILTGLPGPGALLLPYTTTVIAQE